MYTNETMNPEFPTDPATAACLDHPSHRTRFYRPQPPTKPAIIAGFLNLSIFETRSSDPAVAGTPYFISRLSRRTPALLLKTGNSTLETLIPAPSFRRSHTFFTYSL